MAKAVEVLERLGDGRAWRVADLADAAAISRSTAYRILNTLEPKGWVRREGAVRRYTIGPALTALGRTRRPTEDLVPVARPFMRGLWEEFGETVNLGILAGGRILYLDMIESRMGLKTTSRVGSSDPLHSTALGRAILAHHPVAEARRLLLSVERHRRTPTTRIDLAELLAELEDTRARGYAIDDEENEVGARCVAASVLDGDSRPVAALSVSAPTLRLDDGRIELIGRALRLSSRELGAVLGLPATPDEVSRAS